MKFRLCCKLYHKLRQSYYVNYYNIVIIFLDFFLVEQIFFSSQVKRSVIIIIKWYIRVGSQIAEQLHMKTRFCLKYFVNYCRCGLTKALYAVITAGFEKFPCKLRNSPIALSTLAAIYPQMFLKRQLNIKK